MKFENDILQRDLSFYDSARSDAVDTLRRNFNVLSIYEFGTVKVPGISDIDLMMVLNSGKSNQPTAPNAADVLPENVKSIAAGGTVMVLSDTLFSKINIWDDIRTTHLWGEHLELIPISYSSEHLQLARMVDWIPERTLRLAQMLQMSSVKTSRTIGIIYSLCHSLRKVISDLKTGKTSEIESYIKRIDHLRSTWFDSDPRARESDLARCVSDGLNLAKTVLPLLAHQLEIIGLVDTQIDGRLNLGRTGTLLFRNEIANDDIAIDENVVLPSILYEHFRNYALGNGIISQSIRSSMQPEPSPNNTGRGSTYRSLLSERIDWVEQQAKFLLSQGFTTGLYKFGWFFSPSIRGVD